MATTAETRQLGQIGDKVGSLPPAIVFSYSHSGFGLQRPLSRRRSYGHLIHVRVF